MVKEHRSEKIILSDRVAKVEADVSTLVSGLKQQTVILEQIQESIANLQLQGERQQDGSRSGSGAIAPSPQGLPQASNRSQTEEKIYELLIEGVVGEKNDNDGSYFVVKRAPITVTVTINKADGTPVEDDDPLASVTVKLAVVDEETCASWDNTKFVESMEKNQKAGMQVENGIFELTKGRGVHDKARITKNSTKHEVKLGVMMHACKRDIGETRVIEGVSSNLFRVKDRTESTQNKRKKPEPSAQHRNRGQILDRSIPIETDSDFPVDGYLDDNGRLKSLIEHILSKSLYRVLEEFQVTLENIDTQGILRTLRTGLEDLKQTLIAPPGKVPQPLLQNLQTCLNEIKGSHYARIMEYVGGEDLVRNLGQLLDLLTQLTTTVEATINGQPGGDQDPGSSQTNVGGSSYVNPYQPNPQLQLPAPPTYPMSSGAAGRHDSLGPLFTPELTDGALLDFGYDEGGTGPESMFTGTADGALLDFGSGGGVLERPGFVHRRHPPYAKRISISSPLFPVGCRVCDPAEAMLELRQLRQELQLQELQQLQERQKLWFLPQQQKEIVMEILKQQPQQERQQRWQERHLQQKLRQKPQQQKEEIVMEILKQKQKEEWREGTDAITIIGGEETMCDWGMSSQSRMDCMPTLAAMVGALDINRQQATHEGIDDVVIQPEAPFVKQSHVLRVDKEEVSSASTESKSSFDKFMVLDLKATWLSVEESKKNKEEEPLLETEIVELSSILVDAATGQLLDPAFHTYVRPTRKGGLISRYCMEYNDIKQEDNVEGDGAVMLPQALQMHESWLQENHGAGGVVVTWGGGGLKMQHQECQRKGLAMPGYFRRWINLNKSFASRYGDRYWGCPVREALEATNSLTWECHGDEPPDGGLSHARNMARLLAFLKDDGATLTITEPPPEAWTRRPMPMCAAATTSTTTQLSKRGGPPAKESK